MNEIEILERHFKELEPMSLELAPSMAFALLGTLQLALGHPANRGPTSRFMRAFCDDLISHLAAGNDVVEGLLRRGDDPNFDEEADRAAYPVVMPNEVEPTPGPWSIEHDGPYVTDIVGRGPANCALMEADGDTESCRIASIFGGHARGVAEANARLIAALPKMRDALLSVLAWLTNRKPAEPADLAREAMEALREAGVPVDRAAYEAFERQAGLGR